MATTLTRRHSSANSGRTTPQQWRMPWGTAAIGLVMLLGVLLLLYPSTASWFAQYNQSRVIENTSARTDEGPPSRLQNELSRAREYNDALAIGESVLSPESNVPTSQSAAVGGFDYHDLLRASPDGVMARIRIPAIGVELPIYHGTSDEVLAKGVGHLEGSSLPVGGTSQHSVLTAHRGLPSAELFNDLHRLTVGDTFTVEAFGEVLTYRATQTATILPDETQSLLPQQGEDLMTLVTCTPLGINTHRYLVTGERVTPTPIGDVQRAGASPQIPGFPWWALALAAAIGAYTAVVIRSGKPKPTSNARARSRHPGAPRLLGYGASHMDDAFGPDDGDGDGEVSSTAWTQN